MNFMDAGLLGKVDLPPVPGAEHVEDSICVQLQIRGYEKLQGNCYEKDDPFGRGLVLRADFSSDGSSEGRGLGIPYPRILR